MNNKFIYTAEDVQGLTVKWPDYSQCKGCALDATYEKRWKCAAYPQEKPDSVVFDKKPCEHRIPE